MIRDVVFDFISRPIDFEFNPIPRISPIACYFCVVDPKIAIWELTLSDHADPRIGWIILVGLIHLDRFSLVVVDDH